MDTLPWWQGATPHHDIQSGRLNEALFEAKLGEAIQDRGPDEYRLAGRFFEKTFFTAGLRELLTDVLHTLSGRRAANAVVNLKTSFGGGKTHTELAVYHLFAHPEESMGVPQVAELVRAAGLDAPPPCRVAVLPGTNLSPTGRTVATGRQVEGNLTIRTLWGEMAYALGGPELFAALADEDAQRVSPGEDRLRAVLERAGPSVILLDETLHYVDKAAKIASDPAGEDLAKQTVAFLRELSAVVDSLGNSMLVVSLTASKLDQLSDHALSWLGRMEHHINRLAHACTPIEGAEIHEVVRRRLFDDVNEKAAAAAAARYHQLYSDLGGLDGRYVAAAYTDLIRRSYPFHPELITVIYERWGAKPGFQLTRGTLRFLALVLQDLWGRQEEVAPDLILMGHVSAADSGVRAMIRDIGGEQGHWESVIGSDVAAPEIGGKAQRAKSQLIDDELGDGRGLAQALATTILLYSFGGGENPEATRPELRLALARHDVEEARWDNLLAKLRRRLFYLYYDREETKYRFRMEPNVTSLHHTYRVNMGEGEEVAAYVNKIIWEKALGGASATQRFSGIYYLPDKVAVADGTELKLVVLGFDRPVENNQLLDDTRAAVMEVLERYGGRLREHRNTLIFSAPDRERAEHAREWVADFLSWRKIEQNPTDWDRIGRAQQEQVKMQREETESAALQAITAAYTCALVPIEDRATSRLSLQLVPLGTYGPGKYIAPMVWDILAGRTSPNPWLLEELTPQTFLERHGAAAWPESEKWVTTAELWRRFTTQVGLPVLTREGVLLETLREAAAAGLLAVGLLLDAASPRDQRDSYVYLYFKEPLPPNTPVVGERWLVMRPDVYRRIAEQPERVTAEEIVSEVAVEMLQPGRSAVSIRDVYKRIKDKHRHGIDDASFNEAVQAILKEGRLGYRENGRTVTEIAVDDPEALTGEFFKDVGIAPPRANGRTIVIRGMIEPGKDLAPLFQRIVRPLSSQNPASLMMELTITAQFNEDPGGGLDATLDDAFDNNAFPGLRREDSKSG
jgi:hypothetical protein